MSADEMFNDAPSPDWAAGFAEGLSIGQAEATGMNAETVTMVGPNGQVVEGVDRETAAAAAALMADIETRITAAYEQSKEVGRVNGAARLDEAHRKRDQAQISARVALDELKLTLAMVREQRDWLEGRVSTTKSGVQPCGDGRCYCGGCVL